MNSRLASLTKIRNSIFEDRGHIHSLLKEWYSLRNRFTAQDLIADEASVEGDPEPSAKRARISTSSSTPATTVDDNNTRVEELDTTTTQVSSLDAAERVGESSATPQPKPDKLTDIEDTLLKSFIPTEHMDLVKGNVLAGFSYDDPLNPFKKPSDQVNESQPGSYLLSIVDVLYIYTVASHKGGVWYLKLAYQEPNKPPLPGVVMLEDPDLDNCLFLTEGALLVFDVEGLVKGDSGTDWGSETKIEAATYSAPGEKADPTTILPNPAIPSSFMPPPRQVPRSTSPSALSSSPTSTFSVAYEAQKDALSSLITGLGSTLANSITPHSMVVSAKEAEKSRILLFKVTGSKEHVLAMLSTAGDATKTSATFLSDLLDTFLTNVGGSDATEYMKIPLVQDGKAIQAFLLGKAPDGLTTINWDKKLKYGSARICFAHFLSTRTHAKVPGGPSIPTTAASLNRMFTNIVQSFFGLFNKEILRKKDPRTTYCRQIFKTMASHFNTIVFNEDPEVNIMKVSEYRLVRHIQSWLHTMFAAFSRQDDKVLPYIKGGMTDLPHDPKDNKVFEKTWDALIGDEIVDIFYKFWGDKEIYNLVREHKKGDFYTDAHTTESLERVNKELIDAASYLPPPKKEDKTKGPAGSGASIASGATGISKADKAAAKAASKYVKPGWTGGGFHNRGPPTLIQVGPPQQWGGPPQYFTSASSMAPISVMGSGQSVGTFHPGAGSGYPNPGNPGPKPPCFHNLQHLFRPQSTGPCRNGASCDREHIALPPTEALKLDLVNRQLALFQGQTAINRQGQPNRLRAIAIPFLQDVYSEISAKMSLPGTKG